MAMNVHPEATQKVSRAVDLAELQAQIRILIMLEETETPVISCYIHRVVSQNGARVPEFAQRLRAIRNVLRGQELEEFEERFSRIQSYLTSDLRPTTQGVALFARGGRWPFFMALQFDVPLPSRLSVNSTPDVYHLVELKDTYHRFVVLISTEESARILEVNLGTITRQLWAERPELRDRVGKEWTHEHYQNHRRDRGEAFMREKLAMVEKLMAAEGHTHLILAGLPHLAERVRERLPKHIQAKIMDVVPTSEYAGVVDVVAATLSTFIEHVQAQSQSAVAQLETALRTGGLAASGTPATYEALRQGQIDVLVMAREYHGSIAWICAKCGWVHTTQARPKSCPDCEHQELRTVNLKEEMIRIAERQAVKIDLVQQSEVLVRLGGVGCLLRWEATPIWGSS